VTYVPPDWRPGPQVREYLLYRGYTEQTITSEGVLQVPKTGEWEGRQIKDCDGHIGWQVLSMSGQAIGLQTRPHTEKHYRFHQLPDTEHLPLAYGTPGDWSLLWATGELILTEGAFDRIAIKRAMPERCVLARMSKGAPNQLRTLLKRYARTMWTAFDNDEAGEKATETTERKLQETVNIHQLRFTHKDPAKTLEKQGMNRFRRELEKQTGATA